MGLWDPEAKTQIRRGSLLALLAIVYVFVSSFFGFFSLMATSDEGFTATFQDFLLELWFSSGWQETPEALITFVAGSLLAGTAGFMLARGGNPLASWFAAFTVSWGTYATALAFTLSGGFAIPDLGLGASLLLTFYNGFFGLAFATFAPSLAAQALTWIDQPTDNAPAPHTPLGNLQLPTPLIVACIAAWYSAIALFLWLGPHLSFAYAGINQGGPLTVLFEHYHADWGPRTWGLLVFIPGTLLAGAGALHLAHKEDKTTGRLVGWVTHTTIYLAAALLTLLLRDLPVARDQAILSFDAFVGLFLWGALGMAFATLAPAYLAPRLSDETRQAITALPEAMHNRVSTRGQAWQRSILGALVLAGLLLTGPLLASNAGLEDIGGPGDPQYQFTWTEHGNTTLENQTRTGEAGAFAFNDTIQESPVARVVFDVMVQRDGTAALADTVQVRVNGSGTPTSTCNATVPEGMSAQATCQAQIHINPKPAVEPVHASSQQAAQEHALRHLSHRGRSAWWMEVTIEPGTPAVGLTDTSYSVTVEPTYTLWHLSVERVPGT